MRLSFWTRIAAGSLTVGLLLSACSASVSAPDTDGGPPIVGGPDAGPIVSDDGGGPALRLDYVDPDHGTYAGGTQVILRGRGFKDGMTVTFGGRLVEPLDLHVLDSHRAEAYTPPGEVGPADVVVTADGASTTHAEAYEYEPLRISPTSGAVAGGTYMTIRGFGTHFADGDIVTVAGQPMTDVTVVSDELLTGYTPPGVPGTADVTVEGALTYAATDAYTYLNGADPFDGGLGGGDIEGSLNVTVIDAYTQNGVPMAFVAVGDPATTPYKGVTDEYGAITFSAPDLAGPVTVTAAKEMYESSRFVVFDSRDVTIFLVPLPQPAPPGPFPPGRLQGTIYGDIYFGNAVGIGTTNWALVPEPRTPTENKRCYVYTTGYDVFSAQFNTYPTGTIDYTNDGRTAWDFAIPARSSALAVVALCGLYDPTIDTDGDGPNPPGYFEPFAMGVKRGILVGPGEVITNMSILVDIPIDTAIDVELMDPPHLDTATWNGPIYYKVWASIDLGGEGVISLPGSVAQFPAGKQSVLLPGMAPLQGVIGDASYALVVGAYSNYDSYPMSARVVRGVTDLNSPVFVDDFLGVPRPIDPPPSGSLASSHHVQFAPEPGTNGVSTFNVHLLAGADGTPLWRIFTRGDQLDVALPDLTSLGVPPTQGLCSWYIYEVSVPGLSFDDFTYRYLSSNSWSAYAFAAQIVVYPPP